MGAFAAIGALGLVIPLVNGPLQAILQATVPAGLQTFKLIGELGIHADNNVAVVDTQRSRIQKNSPQHHRAFGNPINDSTPLP